MILIDDRIGSSDIVRYITPRSNCKLTRLPFGDAAFTGRGPNNSLVQVGVEVKTVSDVLNCIASGRFAGHQLPGMLKAYQCCYLVVEGVYKVNHKSGILELPRRGGWVAAQFGGYSYMYRDLDAWLMTMENMCGVKVRRTFNRRETAQVIMDLHGWWTGKPWEKHRSHLCFDTSREPAAFRKPSLMRKIAAQLPGIGWHKSQAVARYFGSVLDMAIADEKDWMEVDGVGKGLSGRIVKALQGRR